MAWEYDKLNDKVEFYHGYKLVKMSKKLISKTPVGKIEAQLKITDLDMYGTFPVT